MGGVEEWRIKISQLSTKLRLKLKLKLSLAIFIRGGVMCGVGMRVVFK